MSIIWIIFLLLAAAVAIGIAVQRVRSEGPTITIALKEGNGIEPGKTFIRYKDVRIGVVTAMELSGVHDRRWSRQSRRTRRRPDGRGCQVRGRRAAYSAVRRVGAQHTVVGQGHRVPGRQIDRAQSIFAGTDTPPSITDEPGRRFELKAFTLGSLGVGTPVYYRRIQAGHVAAYNLAAGGKSVDVTVFVRAPIRKNVTTETRFWSASGSWSRSARRSGSPHGSRSLRSLPAVSPSTHPNSLRRKSGRRECHVHPVSS